MSPGGGENVGTSNGGSGGGSSGPVYGSNSGPGTAAVTGTGGGGANSDPAFGVFGWVNAWRPLRQVRGMWIWQGWLDRLMTCSRG